MSNAGTPSTRALDATPAPGIVRPEDRLPMLQTLAAGVQHVIAMFGATVLGPLLMGFDTNVAIFFSGIATLIFYAVLGGRIPSYLGSSFSFIGAVIAVTGWAPAAGGAMGLNPHIDLALSGIIAAGAIYAAIGALVMVIGAGWIEALLPPVLTGTIVAIIGLNLAPVCVGEISKNGFTQVMGLFTLLLVAVLAVCFPSGSVRRRMSILIGVVLAYAVYYFASNLGLARVIGLDPTDPIVFTQVATAAWIGLPHFTTPTYNPGAITLIAPVAIVLIAENLGHIKAIGGMLGRERQFNSLIGRAFLADGVATMVSASCGGTGVTTYAENMGVMRVTGNFSSRTFVVAALFAILLGLSPKLGALIHTIPLPVIGGLSFVIFGIITAVGVGIWVQNGVDFTRSRTLITVGTALVAGSGNLTINLGGFAFGGIATATFIAIIVYHLLGLVDANTREDAASPPG
jgi:putative pyrimidine permease RutG